MNKSDPQIGGLYEHYKGKPYIVHAIVKHSETLEDLVYYECLYENELGKHWVRPITMFLEKIEVNGMIVPRFKYMGPSSTKG